MIIRDIKRAILIQAYWGDLTLKFSMFNGSIA
jgi:hypothetical protein